MAARLPYTGSTPTGTSYGYDGLGRLRLRTNPDSTTVTYAYGNGIDVTVTDERSKVTVQDWSAFGDPGAARLTGLRDANDRVWGYAYNALGSLTLVDPPGGGGNRSWVYNARNQLQSETHPEAGQVSYTYDPAGNLKTRVDPGFGTTTFNYDADDRVVGIDRPGGGAHDVVQGWDASDNRTSLANSFVSSTFTYDGANRLTARTDVVDGRTFTTVYVPDGNDNLGRIDYPSGLRVSYAYDSENRLNDVRRTGSASALGTSFSYHPSGQPSSFLAGNGRSHVFSYTSRHWVDTINDGALSLDYGYDGAGNVASIVDSRPGMSQSFGYDNLDRLQSASGFWGSGSYGYEDGGDRLSQTVAGSRTFTYQSGRLTAVAGTGADSFGYDLNGNLKTSTGFTYGYTPGNMVASVTTGSGTTTYAYDGDGQRVRTGESGGVLRYALRGPRSETLSEYEVKCGALRWVRDYVYAGTRLLATMKAVPGVVTVRFNVGSGALVESAGSASVRAVRDASRNVIERHDYLPFGEEWCGGAVCGSVAPGQPKRFTGKERDVETGLDYFVARYYGSKIGRFTTVDPYLDQSTALVDPQQWNHTHTRATTRSGTWIRTAARSRRRGMSSTLVSASCPSVPTSLPATSVVRRSTRRVSSTTSPLRRSPVCGVARVRPSRRRGVRTRPPT